MKTRYLFICGVLTPSRESEFQSKMIDIVMSRASSTFQWNIIDGLHENGVDFDVLTVPEIPGYPQRYSERYIKEEECHLYYDIFLIQKLEWQEETLLNL